MTAPRLEGQTNDMQLAITAQQAVLARSTRDRAFRDQLLSNPRAALAAFADTSEAALGPANIAFVENKADVTFVLPEFVGEDDELSSSELEAVAGGSPLVVALFFVGAAAWTEVAGELYGLYKSN